MRSAVKDEAQTGINIARRNISNFRHADDTTLMAESEKELKSLLMTLKEESEKVGLKLNIQLQDIKLTHRNSLHSYMLTMRKHKEKLRKQYHSPLQQKE